MAMTQDVIAITVFGADAAILTAKLAGDTIRHL
jgi:hypothetical protein